LGDCGLAVEVVGGNLGDASEGVDSAEDVANFVVAGAGGGGVGGADGGGDGILTVLLFLLCGCLVVTRSTLTIKISTD
jgi:hypothetical protein